METQLEIQKIGFRIQDLVSAGLPIPDDKEELTRSFITLSTATLRAEKIASEAQLESARKELTSARLAEAELTIYSPVSGTIGARYIEEGERVKREDKIITVIDTDSFYAIFPAPEKDALRIEKGMTARVSLDGTGSTYYGTVDLVSPQADSQSFTFLVRVLLPRESFLQKELKPGMFARVFVKTGSPRTAAVVPESSLANKGKGDGENEVFIVNGNTISGRKIAIGSVIGEGREIISGLNAGEIVVLHPDPSLREGTYVSISN
jgi:RND family efflux transporter MFP subunit